MLNKCKRALIQVEIVHTSTFKSGTVEKKVTLAFVSHLFSLVVTALQQHRRGPIVDDEFFSTVFGLNFSICV